MCAPVGSSHGLEIISTGSTTVEKASGESVKLDCQFTLAPEDSGSLDIEWSLQPSDTQDEEKVVSVCVCVCFVCGAILLHALHVSVLFVFSDLTKEALKYG